MEEMELILTELAKAHGLSSLTVEHIPGMAATHRFGSFAGRNKRIGIGYGENIKAALRASLADIAVKSTEALA